MAQITDEELAKMQQQFKMEDGTKRTLDKLVARRKLKKQYEYEVQWKGFDPTQNTWMPRDKCAPCICPMPLAVCLWISAADYTMISSVGRIEIQMNPISDTAISLLG